MAVLNQYPHLLTLQAMVKRRRVKVFLVGGFVRDALLGKPSSDLDFAVSKGAISLARAFAKSIKAAFVLLDEEHGCARVVKRDGKIIWTYDFSDFRGKDIKADIHLRDFTVNALCADIEKLNTVECLSDAISDLSGRGLQDLKKGVIRMSSPRAFADDPLRLLRAFTLQATLGFSVETQTRKQMVKDLRRLNEPAMERIREEFFKILQSPRAFQTLTALDDCGALITIIPSLAVMKGVHQGGYHHLDVWKHSLETINQFEQLTIELKGDVRISAYLNELVGGGHSRLALLKLGLLLHDIGKPETMKDEGTRKTFHGHEHVGERITRQVSRRLKVSVKEQHWLEDAVRCHLRPGSLSNFETPTPKAVFRYMRETGREAAAIAILAIADQRATRGPLTTKEKAAHHEKICRMLIEKFFEKPEKPLPRLLSGHDLIKKLKLQPSPLFAEILLAVEEGQALGKISTKKQALDLARSMIK